MPDTRGSEYGGRPGIIQRPEGDLGDYGGMSDGHTELTVGEQAMTMRRAGLKEANGIGKEEIKDRFGNVIGVIAYDEDQAYLDYIDGNNT